MQVIPKLHIKPTKNQLGITYIEIMIVVVIIAIVAVVTMPSSSPTDTRKLDLAAEEIAQAIRFARLEAIRTASPYGVEFNSSNNTVKVYSLKTKWGFPTPTFNVYHPVDKKLYTLNIKTDSATTGVNLYSYSIYFSNSATNRQNLGFNSSGTPKYSSGGTDSMLNGSATITLSFTGQTRLISVAPMTGRVTVQ